MRQVKTWEEVDRMKVGEAVKLHPSLRLRFIKRDNPGHKKKSKKKAVEAQV